MDRTELDGLAVFLAVSEHNGFRAAARYLGLTASAVSQTIRNLELRIGAPLFSRTTRSISLTEAGQQLLLHAKPAADMFQAGLNAARDLGEQPSGNLRINAPRPSIPLLVNSLLPDFHETYPKISLELFGEDEMVDIVNQGFDAGIRLGHTVELDMVSIWLTPPEKYVVVGAPMFFNKHGIPTVPEDLQRFPCVLLRRNKQIIKSWEFVRDRDSLPVAVNGPLVLNDYEACIRAATRGVGLHYMVKSLARSYLEQGILTSVLDDFAIEVPGLSLYYPSRSQCLPKLRAFVEFAKQRLRREIASDAFAAQLWNNTTDDACITRNS